MRENIFGLFRCWKTILKSNAVRFVLRHSNWTKPLNLESDPGTKGMQQGLNLSRALDNILDVQDDLIDRWVEYETARLQLFRDMGTMRLDERGFWVDDFYQQLDSEKTDSELSLPKDQDPLEELQAAVSSKTDNGR